MQKRSAAIAPICFAQYLAVGVGMLWGLGRQLGFRWPDNRWSFAGELAVFLLGVEGVRGFASYRLRTNKPIVPWACIGLGLYASWLMLDEAFLWYIDNGSFIRGILLLMPFLLSINLLGRSGAWVGVVGSGLFFATALAMVAHNGCSLSGGSGFFVSWIS